MVWVLIGLSVFIAALGVRGAKLEPKSVFYAMVVCNILLAGYLVLVRNFTLGILIYLYSLTFLNKYWRLVIPGQWPDIDIPRLMFIFIWFVILLETAMGERRLLPRTWVEWSMLALLVSILGVMLTKGHMFIRAFLNGYAIPYAMFIVVKNSFKTRKSVERFVFWFAVPLSIYFPIMTIIEHYRITALVFPRYILSPEISGQEIVWGGRSMGVFLQPVATGLAMVICYALSMYKLSEMRGLLAKGVELLITVLTPIAVFFTYTRSVYLAYFLSVCVFAVFSRRLRLAAVIIIAAASLVILGNWSNVTSENRQSGGLATRETAISRLALMEVSMEMFYDRPFVGVGFARFMENSPYYMGRVKRTALGYREAWVGKHTNQHNQLFTILTEIGLIGFIPLVLIYYGLFRYMNKARAVKLDNCGPEFIAAVWAVWAAYMATVFFIEPRFFEFMNVVPFILAGIVVGGYQRATLRRPPGGNRNERSYAHEGAIR
jgi:hypothetical protein